MWLWVNNLEYKQYVEADVLIAFKCFLMREARKSCHENAGLRPCIITEDLFASPSEISGCASKQSPGADNDYILLCFVF